MNNWRGSGLEGGTMIAGRNRRVTGRSEATSKTSKKNGRESTSCRSQSVNATETQQQLQSGLRRSTRDEKCL